MTNLPSFDQIRAAVEMVRAAELAEQFRKSVEIFFYLDRLTGMVFRWEVGRN